MCHYFVMLRNNAAFDNNVLLSMTYRPSPILLSYATHYRFVHIRIQILYCTSNITSTQTVVIITLLSNSIYYYFKQEQPKVLGSSSKSDKNSILHNKIARKLFWHHWNYFSVSFYNWVDVFSCCLLPFRWVNAKGRNYSANALELRLSCTNPSI